MFTAKLRTEHAMPDFSICPTEHGQGWGHISLRTQWRAQDPQQGAAEGAEPGQNKEIGLPRAITEMMKAAPQAILNSKGSQGEI